MTVSVTEFFLPKYYLALYSDVAEACGFNDENALKHYLEHGYKEDRSPNPLFHPAWYLTGNKDIRENLGDQPIIALWHWLRHGLEEGRQGSSLFWSKVYLQENPDLEEAFGSENYKDAATHWLKHGIAEPRISIHELEAEYYETDLAWKVNVPAIVVLEPDDLPEQEMTLEKIGKHVIEEVSLIENNRIDTPHYQLLGSLSHLAKEHDPVQFEQLFDEAVAKAFAEPENT